MCFTKVSILHFLAHSGQGMFDCCMSSQSAVPIVIFTLIYLLNDQLSLSDQSSSTSPIPDDDQLVDVNNISVIITHSHLVIPQQNPATHPPCRTTIKRSNRAVTALSLPNIMVTNHRSIFPKFNNLVDEILENDMHLGLQSEIWEVKDKAAHANKIEEALELYGIQYISTPRSNRRGGGAAITLISDSPFVLTQLDAKTFSGETSLEVCWGLLSPKVPTGHIKSMIVCAFYIPPFSRKKSALIEHISLNYYIFKSIYSDSAFICGGDKNDLNTQLLLDINPSFRQLVDHPTYRLSTLDVLITDIGQYYLVPIIRPPVCTA